MFGIIWAWLSKIYHLAQSHSHTGDQSVQLTGASLTSGTWATTADLADVAAAEAAGSATTVPRGDHVHTIGSGVITNAMVNSSAAIAITKLASGVDATSYTPTLAGDSTAGSNTYTTQVGRYCRIGPLVVVQFNVVLATKDAAMAGNIYVSIPVAAASVTSLFGAGAVYHSGITLSAGYTQIAMLISQGTSRAFMYKNGSGAAGAFIVAADVAGTAQVVGTFAYLAA